MRAPEGVLMCPPTHYSVAQARNPHTTDAAGMLRRVDPRRARRQWQALHDAYVELGLEVRLASADPQLPDQVFTANPVRTGPGRKVIASCMTYPERAGEVQPLLDALDDHRVVAAARQPVEGGGDLIWHRGALLVGHGFRSGLDEALAVASKLADETLPMRLGDPRFYHLDTALCVLADDACLWVPAAFDAASRELVHSRFRRRFEVPMDEAMRMAANAHAVDGTVLIDATTPATQAWLHDEDFDVVALDTSEFRKAGGSVFCMKQEVW